MVNYFSGKPPMGGASTRGSSGVPRIPPGRLSAPPGSSPPPGGRGGYLSGFSPGLYAASQYALSRAGYGYMALSRIDPAQSRRAAQRADAYLSQFLPSWYWTWDQDLVGWMTAGGSAGGDPYAPYRQGLTDAGFVRFCTGIQIGGRPWHKIGYAPAAQSFCNNNGNFGTPGALVGDDIPAGVSWVQFGSGLSNVPPPDPFMWVEERWDRPAGPSPAPIKYKVGFVLPLEGADGAPAPAEEIEQSVPLPSQARLGYGFVVSTIFQFSTRPQPGDSGQGSKTPDAPYRDAPPPPRTRERKWKLGKGGIVGDVFGAATEIQDAMDCAVKAIKSTAKTPRSAGHKRWLGAPAGKSKGVYNKSKYIAQNFDVGNPDMVMAFLTCMAQNEITDRIVGEVSSRAGKAFGNASGSPRGPTIKRPPPVPSDLLNSGQSWF